MARAQQRVYRWIGLLLAPAAVMLAVLTPSAMPAVNPPPAQQPTPAIQLPAVGVRWINAASAAELAQQIPGIGPLYAERITTHRRLFGPIADAQTLVDLGIPASVVERLASRVSFDP